MESHGVPALAPYPRRKPVLGDGVRLPEGVELLTGSDMPMHVKASPNEIRGAYGIVAGDPGRIGKIAARFDEPAEVTTYRGFAVFRGSLEGVPVFAAAHGIGSASAAIVFEELAMLGCHTLIRVGTCGSLQAGMRVGDVVISTGCVREDGTTRAYVPDAFPAIASHEVVTALRVAAAAGAPGARPALVGVTHCKGSFYSEVPGYVPDAAAAEARWGAWVGAGAVATEMEAAALFVVGAARGLRTGGIFAVLGITKEGPGGASEHSTAEAMASILTDASAGAAGKERAIDAAVAALRLLIRHDTGAAGASSISRPAAAPPAPPAAAPVASAAPVALLAAVAGIALGMLLARRA